MSDEAVPNAELVETGNSANSEAYDVVG